MRKISIIGAGNVGATTAYYLAKSGIADVVMVDVVEGMPQSKALDFQHAGPIEGFRCNITGTNNYADIQDSDVVVHTAGIPRKPGMDRMDLLKTNVGIAKDAAEAIRTYAPNSVVIAVANPLDVIAMALLRGTGFDPRRVVGMAGVLDSTRFRYFIAEELDVLPENVTGMVLGGHGDTMVPLPRYTSVGGFGLAELLDAETIERLVERTRKGGGEIVSYLKQGSAFYAPGASVAQMVEAVLLDQKRLIAASAFLEGEYGYSNVFLGVPVVLGAQGIERIIELNLTFEEKAALDGSVAAVQKGVEELDSVWN
ncbi:MAG: malate dehydrogenase [Spirochaetaceae bacterium]|nr:MAG: malate dehydrogenase [Spirochaetaceae bacterium]